MFFGSSGFPVGDAAAFRSPGSVRRPAPEKRKAIFRAAPLGLQRVRSVMWAPDRPPSPSHAPDPCGGDATATAGSLSSFSVDRTAICRWRRDSSAVRQASSAGAKGRRGLICIRGGRLPTRKPEASVFLSAATGEASRPPTAPKGHPNRSPGQRPGSRRANKFTSPVRAIQEVVIPFCARPWRVPRVNTVPSSAGSAHPHEPVSAIALTGGRSLG